MRKLFSFILLFTFLHGQVGYPMALHYCSEADMYYVFIGNNDENTCLEDDKKPASNPAEPSCCQKTAVTECEIPADASTVTAKACCSDEDFHLRLNESGKEPTVFSLVIDPVVIVLPLLSTHFSAIVSCGTICANQVPHPPQDSPQAYLSVFRI